MQDKCPYCEGEVSLKDSAVIYNGTSYGDVYICENFPECDSYVGVHKGTDKPKGTLANKQLRTWRKLAHAEFDTLWQSNKISRSAAYSWLANRLGINKEECHIGMFDKNQCQDVCELIENYNR